MNYLTLLVAKDNLVVLENFKNMKNSNSLINLISKINNTLQIFLKQEELIKKSSKKIIKTAVNKSNEQKIEKIKNKIEKI